MHFFREICGVARSTKEVLRARTDDYNRWVAAYAANGDVPLSRATKGERKEEVVRPFLERCKRAGRFGLYYVILSQERGPSFRICPPKYPGADPDYMIVRAPRSLYRHDYFYIHDKVLGAMLLRVGSFFPFALTAYLNGHEFIARRLQEQGVAFTQPDNCFTAAGDREALQAAADAFSPEVLQERIDYWCFHLGPKFSEKGARGVRRAAPVLGAPAGRILPQPSSSKPTGRSAGSSSGPASYRSICSRPTGSGRSSRRRCAAESKASCSMCSSGSQAACLSIALTGSIPF